MHDADAFGKRTTNDFRLAAFEVWSDGINLLGEVRGNLRSQMHHLFVVRVAHVATIKAQQLTMPRKMKRKRLCNAMIRRETFMNTSGCDQVLIGVTICDFNFDTLTALRGNYHSEVAEMGRSVMHAWSLG